MTITTLTGETFVLKIDGNSVKATANDFCALANEACGYDACVPAVLFLNDKLMAGDKTVAEHIMDSESAASEANAATHPASEKAHQAAKRCRVTE